MFRCYSMNAFLNVPDVVTVIHRLLKPHTFYALTFVHQGKYIDSSLDYKSEPIPFRSQRFKVSAYVHHYSKKLDGKSFGSKEDHFRYRHF